MAEISVVMPVYIGEENTDALDFLRVAMDSMQAQTFKDFEMIMVCEPGTSQASLDILEGYAKEDPRMKIIVNEERLGISASMNVGIRAASGKYIARMDTDDICKPDRFKKQIAYMERHPECDILSSWVDEFIGNTSHIVSTRKLPENHDAIVKYGKKRNPINHPAVIFRRKAVVAAGGYPHFPKAQVEDYELWVRMIVNGALFHNIQESLLYYRLSDDFARRRGGWDYSQREIPLQISFYKKGYISWWRMALNIVIRTIIRMLPSRWRRKVYLCLLR